MKVDKRRESKKKRKVKWYKGWRWKILNAFEKKKKSLNFVQYIKNGGWTLARDKNKRHERKDIEPTIAK